MIKSLLITLLFTMAMYSGFSQCAVCKNTASSLDEKSAKGMNTGILYLAAMPLLMMGFIGYRWWQHHKDPE